MRLQSYLQTELNPNGITERSTTLQNVKLNGLVFDFRFTPDEDYIAGNATQSPYRVLKNIVINVNQRTGQGTGKNALLIDRVNLYLLMEHSDFIAGLDITQTPMEAGKEWRACGHLGLGYLEVSEKDSLDIQIYSRTNPEIASKLYVSTELTERSSVDYVQYRETKPTGSSQTFENVLAAYITTDEEMNESISTTDMMANEVIPVETCIAYSNAVGRFEKFKRYGQFYADEYGVGQTLTFNCPTTNADAEILLVCRVFNLTTQVNGDQSFVSDARALMTKIASENPEKFKALKLQGANTYGVTLAE